MRQIVSSGILTFIAVIALAAIQFSLQPNLDRSVDWSVDQINCQQNDKVRITMTNLCPKKSVSFDANRTVWEVRKEGEIEPAYAETTTKKVEILPGNNYIWELPMKKLPQPGVYRLFPAYIEQDKKGRKGLWEEPLKRAICVSTPTKESPSKV